MTDLGVILLFALIALGVAWLVNGLVALLSGEHPRDTGRVWLDTMLSELRGLSSAFAFIHPRWFRWMVVGLTGIVIFVTLFFIFYAE